MHLVDSNIWLALAIPNHVFNRAAKQWLLSIGRGESLFCRSTQRSFLRLLTRKAVLEPYKSPPLGNKAAWAVYENFRSDKQTGWADEPKKLEPHWKKFSSDPRPSPNLWMDAYLAAFAIVGGYRFVTADRGFKQFKNLDLVLIQ